MSSAVTLLDSLWTMGFSPLGLIASVAVLLPSLLLFRFPPRDRTATPHLPRPMEWLERSGQAMCLVVPSITRPGDIVWWWTIPAVVALVTYYALWARYLVAGRRNAQLYDPLWRIPVPMAVLPVAVFSFTAAWLSNPWIAVGALVLAAGHIPVAVLTRRALSSTP